MKIRSFPAYYVYIHIDPVTEKTMYVGKGCYGRAWDVTRSRNGHPDHLSWMKDLVDRGYLPIDWVRIIKYQLTEEEAFTHEKEYLHSIGGALFNRQSGEDNYQAKLTNIQAQEIYLKTQDGIKHQTLADEYNVSRSAISMIANRKQWRAATACLLK